MKRLFLSVLVCVSALLVFASCSADGNQNVGNDDNAQDNAAVTDENSNGQTDNLSGTVFGAFTAKDLEGNEVTQDVFAQNKLTMVNIWATFCGPCISEMPSLGELASEYKDKGLGIVGIPLDITDEDGMVDESLFDEAVDIVSSTKAEYIHIVPVEAMFEKKLASVITVPETVFVDSNGNQVGESYLGARSKEQWVEIIEELLGEVQ